MGAFSLAGCGTSNDMKEKDSKMKESKMVEKKNMDDIRKQYG